MSKVRKRKKCYYFCDGYCFWYGDNGYICDTDNNRHDGYCPMIEFDKQLEEHAEWIIEQEKKKLNKKIVKILT